MPSCTSPASCAAGAQPTLTRLRANANNFANSLANFDGIEKFIE
jgi:hypothetical protein